MTLLCDAIRDLRHRWKMSQQRFATNLNISIRALANYEKGMRRPPRPLLVMLFEYSAKFSHDDLAEVFRRELIDSLTIGEIRWWEEQNAATKIKD